MRSYGSRPADSCTGLPSARNSYVVRTLRSPNRLACQRPSHPRRTVNRSDADLDNRALAVRLKALNMQANQVMVNRLLPGEQPREIEPGDTAE